MNHLRRDMAPISTTAWAAIDDEIRRALPTFLSARRLVDFSGPHGWECSSVDLGRTEPVQQLANGVEVAERQSLPLYELRREFEIELREIDAIDRGAKAIDLEPAVDAARAIARVEDDLVFNGQSTAPASGITVASSAHALALELDASQIPAAAAAAVDALRERGVGGPYGVALGSDCHGAVMTRTDDGYPVLEHLRLVLDDGPIVAVPVIDGALVLSLRGGDFELVVGEDFSVGYRGHTDTTVRFVLEETMVFRANGPDAAVPLRFADSAAPTAP